MSQLFERVRAQFEEIVRTMGEEKLARCPVSFFASSILAECYGMKLHDRVNDAVVQALSGRINAGLAGTAQLLQSLLPDKDERLRLFKEGLTELVVTAVCNGKLTEKEMRAWRDPPRPCFVQLQVIEAYRRAIHEDGSPPTLTEVHGEFLEENKKSLLPKGFAFRKMLTQTFGLPLSPARRGRPIIGNRKR